MKKDCHIIKNNDLKFISQLEITFSENIEITKEMIIEFRKDIEQIFEDKNFSIIEINKGSLLFHITVQFIFNSVFNFFDNAKIIVKEMVNKLSEYRKKIKNFFSGKKGKKKLILLMNM